MTREEKHEKHAHLGGIMGNMQTGYQPQWFVIELKPIRENYLVLRLVKLL